MEICIPNNAILMYSSPSPILSKCLLCSRNISSIILLLFSGKTGLLGVCVNRLIIFGLTSDLNIILDIILAVSLSVFNIIYSKTT